VLSELSLSKKQFYSLHCEFDIEKDEINVILFFCCRWTQGTGLMNEHNHIAQFIEEQRI
jgi:hypothetical protein